MSSSFVTVNLYLAKKSGIEKSLKKSHKMFFNEALKKHQDDDDDKLLLRTKQKHQREQQTLLFFFFSDFEDYEEASKVSYIHQGDQKSWLGKAQNQQKLFLP